MLTVFSGGDGFAQAAMQHSTGDAWVPPMSDPHADVGPAAEWVYRTFPGEHRGSVCTDSGRWILTFVPSARPLPANASRLDVEVELVVSSSEMPALIDETMCVKAEGEESTLVAIVVITLVGVQLA